MNYLLDTCVISELTKPEPTEKVIGWLTVTPSDSLHISVVSFGEIKKGLTKLPPSRKKQKLTNWFNSLVENYQARILSVELSIAENWGVLQGRAENTGKSMPVVDGLIAATAYTHNLTVVTRNEKDFTPAQIPTLNPWN